MVPLYVQFNKDSCVESGLEGGSSSEMSTYRTVLLHLPHSMNGVYKPFSEDRNGQMTNRLIYRNIS